MCEEYNGWPNYETWIVKLWIDNDEGAYHYSKDMVRHSRYRADAIDGLKDWIEEMNPLNEGANMFVDLMTHALGKVDFGKIADSIAEDEEHEFMQRY